MRNKIIKTNVEIAKQYNSMILPLRLYARISSNNIIGTALRDCILTLNLQRNLVRPVRYTRGHSNSKIFHFINGRIDRALI